MAIGQHGRGLRKSSPVTAIWVVVVGIVSATIIASSQSGLAFAEQAFAAGGILDTSEVGPPLECPHETCSSHGTVALRTNAQERAEKSLKSSTVNGADVDQKAAIRDPAKELDSRNPRPSKKFRGQAGPYRKGVDKHQGGQPLIHGQQIDDRPPEEPEERENIGEFPEPVSRRRSPFLTPLRRVGRRIANAGRAILKTVRRVGEKVSKGAKRIGKAIVKGITSKTGQKVVKYLGMAGKATSVVCCYILPFTPVSAPGIACCAGMKIANYVITGVKGAQDVIGSLNRGRRRAVWHGTEQRPGEVMLPPYAPYATSNDNVYKGDMPEQAERLRETVCDMMHITRNCATPTISHTHPYHSYMHRQFSSAQSSAYQVLITMESEIHGFVRDDGPTALHCSAPSSRCTGTDRWLCQYLQVWRNDATCGVRMVSSLHRLSADVLDITGSMLKTYAAHMPSGMRSNLEELMSTVHV